MYDDEERGALSRALMDAKKARVLAWLSERCERVPNDLSIELHPRFTALWADYAAWCLQRGSQRVSSWEFGQILIEERGVERYHRKANAGPKHPVTHYAGVRIKAS